MKHAGARESCAAAGATVDGRRVRSRRTSSSGRSPALRAAGRCGPAAVTLRRPELAAGNTYFGTGPDCLFVTDPHSGARRRAHLTDVTAAAIVVDRLPNLDFAMSMGLPDDVAKDVVDVAQFAAMLKGTRKPLVVSSPFWRRLVVHHVRDGGGLRRSRQLRLPRHVVAAAHARRRLLRQSDRLRRTRGAPGARRFRFRWFSGPGVARRLRRGRQRRGARRPRRASARAAGSASCLRRRHRRHQHGHCRRRVQRAWGLPREPGASGPHPRALRPAELAVLRKLPDEQWSLELGISTILGTLSRATLLHDVGYLESGLQSALEGVVLGDEIAGYARALIAEVPVDDEALALAEIEAAGPAGHHLGSKMARTHHRSFWRPGTIDQNTHERWLSQEAGHAAGTRPPALAGAARSRPCLRARPRHGAPRSTISLLTHERSSDESPRSRGRRPRQEALLVSAAGRRSSRWRWSGVALASASPTPSLFVRRDGRQDLAPHRLVRKPTT